MKKTLIILMFFLINCSQQNKSKTKSDFCKNELKLISPKDGIKILDLNLTSNIDSVIKIIKKELKITNVETKYGFRFKGEKIQTYIVEVDKQTYLHKMQPVEIIINNKEALINSERIIDVNEIGDWFDNNFPMKEHNSLNKIRFQWTNNIQKEILQKGISDIINGYLRSVDKLSRIKYDKKLCELKEIELKEIEKEIPFEFELGNFSTTEIKPKRMKTE